MLVNQTIFIILQFGMLFIIFIISRCVSLNRYHFDPTQPFSLYAEDRVHVLVFPQSGLISFKPYNKDTADDSTLIIVDGQVRPYYHSGKIISTDICKFNMEKFGLPSVSDPIPNEQFRSTLQVNPRHQEYYQLHLRGKNIETHQSMDSVVGFLSYYIQLSILFDVSAGQTYEQFWISNSFYPIN